jgi:molybdopterin molybdotransferase/putative molybdopterin biosynthesis protein
MRKRIKDDFPSRGEVLSRLFEKWSAPVRAERVPTLDAIGRVLAEDAFSLCDSPVERASMMDGVAVKSEMFSDGIPDASSWTPGADYVRADTGDDFDDAFDAVIPVEDATFLPDGGLRFHAEAGPVPRGLNISGKGDKIRVGAPLVPRGTKLLAADLAALAIGAVSEVSVYRRPKAAFIPTGSELIPLGRLPERGQTVDANSILARHMLEEMGAEALVYPIVPDDRTTLANTLDRALRESDIVVFSAGTSKGAEDFSHALLAERGELICHGVASAPGKPLAIAVIDGKPVINVAGPPIACQNGLDWCVRAVVSAFFAQTVPRRLTVRARLAKSIDGGGPNFEIYVRLDIERIGNEYIAHPLSHFSGPSTDPIRAEGLYITRLKPEPQSAGDIIEIELLR